MEGKDSTAMLLIEVFMHSPDRPKVSKRVTRKISECWGSTKPETVWLHPSARRFKRVCELGPQVFITERENRVNEGGMRVGCSVLLFMLLPERLFQCYDPLLSRGPPFYLD